MSEVKVGDIVWAKMLGFPPWPAVILKSLVDIGSEVNGVTKAIPVRNPKKKYFWVYFFGSHNYAWIPISKLKNYEEHREKNIQPQNYSYFIEGVQEAEEHLGRMKSNPNHIVEVKEEFKVKEKKKKNAKKELQFKQPEVRLTKLTVDIIKNDFMGLLNQSKNLSSNLVFGVVGIGIIGGGVVKNLVKEGHMVNIWNRTSSKCDRLIRQIGSKHKKRLTSFFNARSLLQNSDIILICVSNQKAVDTIFKNSFGINNNKDTILKNKGIVQMTTTGPDTSEDLRAMVEKQGGKYLEAQIQGSKIEAIRGNLIVLAAGEESLFNDCIPCFNAIGKTTRYLGKVGYASKLNLVLQLIKGVNLAVLAEGLALAQHLNVPHTIFLDIFNNCQLASPYLKGKANLIMERDFCDVEQALKYIQRDLKLGLDLSDTKLVPMYVTRIANELFKHCRRLEYGKDDAAAIYMRNKH